MKKIAAIILLLAAGGIAPAQEKSNQLSPSVRIYEPKNISSVRAQQVADFVTTVLTPPGPVGIKPAVGPGAEPSAPVRSVIKVYWDYAPNAIVIRGGTPAEQDAAEALLKRFDVPETKSATESAPPASSFEITGYLIVASTGGSTEPQARPTLPAQLRPVPKELQSALDEMKQTFAYPDYKLWDVVVTQPGGPVELSGILPARPNTLPDSYSLAFPRARVGDNKTITLDGFEFVLKQPFGGQQLPSRIAHNVTLREGQKLVLGKIRLLPSENADLFLILTAKLK